MYLQNLDVEYLYEAPLAMEKENLARRCLRMSEPGVSNTGSERMDGDGRLPETADPGSQQ